MCVHIWPHTCSVWRIWPHICSVWHKWAHTCSVWHMWPHTCSVWHIWPHTCSVWHIWSHICSVWHIWPHTCSVWHIWPHTRNSYTHGTHLIHTRYAGQPEPAFILGTVTMIHVTGHGNCHDDSPFVGTAAHGPQWRLRWRNQSLRFLAVCSNATDLYTQHIPIHMHALRYIQKQAVQIDTC